MPLATTLKVAAPPAKTLRLTGCVAMLGATATALIARVAATLVAEPAEFVTVTAELPASPATADARA